MGFKVTFNSERCKGCEICIASCPKKILAFDKAHLNRSGIHPAMIVNMDECIGCGNCGMMCPDAVITIEKVED